MMAVDNSVGPQPALGEVRKLENPFVRRLAVSVAAPPDAVLRALKSLAWNRGENAFGFQSFFFRMHCSRHYSSAVRVSGSVERRGPVCIVRAEMRLSPADIIGAWAVFLLFAPAAFLCGYLALTLPYASPVPCFAAGAFLLLTALLPMPLKLRSCGRRLDARLRLLEPPI